jgi:hypothetical protein
MVITAGRMPNVDAKRVIKRIEHETGMRKETMAAKELCCYIIRI